MIKYYVVPENRTVYAVLSNTKYDALNKIDKMMGDDFCFCSYSKKYFMPNTFRARAVCDVADTWDEETGKMIAKEKLLSNYYRSLDKRIDMFRESLINVNSRVFETPEKN